MTYMHINQHRQGTILIIVAGISALLASLALTFMVNSQRDINETEIMIRDGQARIMLVAACSYILESSRIGWEPMNPIDPSGLVAPRPKSLEHAETFGWIDVRDGSLGPTYNTSPLSLTDRVKPENLDVNGNQYPVKNSLGDLFPVGKSARFPMHVLVRPPCAISLRVAENPIDPLDPKTQHLKNADPQPAINDYNEWAKGDTYPGLGADGKLRYKIRQDTAGQSWFRILRERSGASFIVTCGAGGTLGYRDWSEVGTDQAYFGDKANFESLKDSEIRLHYRVEWNAAVVATEMNYLREGQEHSFKLSSFNNQGGGHDKNDTGTFKQGQNRGNYSSQWRSANAGGSIQYIQRLKQEPDNW